SLPPPPHIYTLSLHDALPISFLILVSTPAPVSPSSLVRNGALSRPTPWWWVMVPPASSQRSAAAAHASRYLVSASWSSAPPIRRSEEHTSELQSLTNLVCRLL